MNSIDVSRIVYPNTEECTFFSTALGTLPKINHILEYKVTLNKYRKIKITDFILYKHNGLKLNTNRNRNYQKYRRS